MNRVVSRLGITTLVLVAGTVASAQSSTTGGLAGVLRDSAGAPVSGAQIRMTSGQTTRSTTTGADGSYRFGLLNPGKWDVRITKEGYNTITSSVNISTNTETPLNVKMAATTGVVVDVIGSAPTALDTTTTQQGLAISTDTVSAVPKGRDMSSLTFLAPGVAGGGFAGQDPSIGGGSAAENQYVVDGLNTTDFRRGFQGATLVTDFIDQVEVQTGGFKPEFSALGGVVNAVTKSGTNQFQGTAFFTVDAKGLQAVPKRTTFFQQASPANRYDIGATAGGPIIKDKLFYFVGVDVTKTINKAGASEINELGLQDSDVNRDDLQFLGKLNWYVTPDHQLTFATNVNRTKVDQDKLFPNFGDANFGGETKFETTNFNLNWDWTISSTLFLSTKLGFTKLSTKQSPKNSTDPIINDARWYFDGPGRVGGPAPRPGSVDDILADTGAEPTYQRGGFGLYQVEDSNKTKQFRTDLSWFLGSHNLKFGVSYLESKYYEFQRRSGPDRVGAGGVNKQFYGVSQSIRKSTSGFFQEQFNSTNAEVTAVFTGFYAQDSWEMMPGLRVFYGARYEKQEQKDLNNKTFMKFDDFKDQLQPRVGFTWDLNNDGKSKLSGSYARYFENIPQRVAIRVFANEIFLRLRYNAASGTYNVNTGAFTINANPTVTQLIDFGTPFSFDPIAENTKLPSRDEYILGYDQSLGNGWTAGIHAKYRVLKDPIEDMVFTDDHGNPYDEGPDLGPGFGAGAAVLGNPGRYIQWRPAPNSLTLALLAAGETQNNYGINILDYYNPATGLFTIENTRYEDAGNKFSSVDFTLEHKTARSYVNFSYTWSRLIGNYEGVVSSSNGQADGNITASFDYFPYVGYGLLPLDRTHQIKLFGSYRWEVAGNDLNMGFNWSYASGTPKSAFDNTNDLGGYGNASPVDGKLGQFGRNPAVNNVDLHLDYTWRLSGGKMKLIPSVDVFNLFNTRTALGTVEQATTQAGDINTFYGQENGWQTGRRYRFGLKLMF
jgi:hypothetical protein